MKHTIMMGAIAIVLGTNLAAAETIYSNNFEAGSTAGLVQVPHPNVKWRSYAFFTSKVYAGFLDVPYGGSALGLAIIDRVLPASYTITARMSSNAFDFNDFLAASPKAPAVVVFDWRYQAAAPHINFRWATVVFDAQQGVHTCLIGEYHDRWELRHAYPGCPVTAPGGYYDLSIAVRDRSATLAVAGRDILSYTFPTPAIGPAGMAVTSHVPLPNNRVVTSRFGEGRFDAIAIDR